LANNPVQQRFHEFAFLGSKRGAWIGSYVFMPDHFHLFVALNDQKLTLPDWMKSLKGTVSSVLRTAGNSSPYWQKGFFDHVLRSADSFHKNGSMCATILFAQHR
jgi:REP element-mobilizing transposase RayT